MELVAVYGGTRTLIEQTTDDMIQYEKQKTNIYLVTKPSLE